jgi:hypothetical protein
VASSVQICNLALTKLGATRITDLLDETKQARALNAIYDATRDAELAAHPWTFAITRAEIPALTAAPAFGWARAFPKPADCLRLVEVGQFYVLYDTGGTPGFELEGQSILCDEASPLQIRYVQRVTNTGLFAPLFVQSLACRLAFEVCETLTQNLSKREAAWKERLAFIAEAKRANAIERPPQRPQDLSWVRELTGQA